MYCPHTRVHSTFPGVYTDVEDDNLSVLSSDDEYALEDQQNEEEVSFCPTVSIVQTAYKKGAIDKIRTESKLIIKT